jgi:hypothetical protein
MKFGHVFGVCAIAFTSVVGLSDQAFALCGTVSASGQGETRQQAINAANNKGLKETNKLDRNYGGNVNYQPASVSCSEGRFKWNCKITQKFCTK